MALAMGDVESERMGRMLTFTRFCAVSPGFAQRSGR